MKKIKFIMSEVPMNMGLDPLGISVYSVDAQVTDAEGMKLASLGQFATVDNAHDGVRMVSSFMTQLGYSVE